MTRKDYVLLAQAIVATQERIKANAFERFNGKTYPVDADSQLRGVRRAAAAICDALAKDNPPRKEGGGFNPTMFLIACGYGGSNPDVLKERRELPTID